jgi:tRNA A-37 threonylcarbamoyl transferase component Bud32/plasmid stability protein
MSAADHDDPLIGSVLADRYLLTSRLGKGGMAIVYKATDRNLGREVAVKVLRTDVSGDPVAGKRLVREARAAAALHHPNIITIHDVGDHEGQIYVVMEILVGRALSDVLEEGIEISVERALHMAQQVCSALVVAHDHGIIHRDLKPENLFLLEKNGADFIKMLDFSIAKLPTEMVTAALTRAGSVFGTPHYMAPEQVEGKQAVPQTDLYAVGAILYELIVGDPPFDGKSVIDILLQHVRGAIPHINKPNLPAGLDDLVQSLLAKKAAQRPQSAAEVRDILTKMLSDVRGATAMEEAVARQTGPVAQPATGTGSVAPQAPVSVHEQATAPVNAEQINALREAAARQQALREAASPAAPASPQQTLQPVVQPTAPTAAPVGLQRTAQARASGLHGTSHGAPTDRSEAMATLADIDPIDLDLPSSVPLDLPSALPGLDSPAPSAPAAVAASTPDAKPAEWAPPQDMFVDDPSEARTIMGAGLGKMVRDIAAKMEQAPPLTTAPTVPDLGAPQAPTAAPRPPAPAPRPSTGATPAAHAKKAEPPARPEGLRETMSGHEAPTAAIQLPDDWQSQLKAGSAAAVAKAAAQAQSGGAHGAPPPASGPPSAPPPPPGPAAPPPNAPATSAKPHRAPSSAASASTRMETATTDTPQAPPASKTGLYIGIAVAVVVAGTAAWYFLA